ncbi:MAG: UDP-N-acetylmuramate:L-alanyl-gamma-D-glutamyl-meso-diaminopimelate ligase [Chthoniobacteraceae bacterium]
MTTEPRHLHFIGVGGTAMGSVAAALEARGFTVTGSDEKVYPPMSDFLAERGVEIVEGYAPQNIPESADLIVVGNAISRGNPEIEAVLNRKLTYLSLPETLKLFFLRGKHNLVVAGTHGKTTTSSLLAWILQEAGLAPSYMIGGIARNLGQGCSLHESKYTVIEGDEYDTAFFDKRSKFLHYLPELVIVNNIEFDHADIFEDLDAIKLSFRRLLNIVPNEGMVLVNGDDPNAVEVAKGCLAQLVEVGFSKNAARHIRDIEYRESGSAFTLLDHRFEMQLLGEFNVRNAAMAVSAAHFYGVSLETISTALASFEGIKRRQELRGTVRGIPIIDDFGHHPTAIRETLRGLRYRYPGRRLWALFEPRSNTTRRAIFQHELPKALGEADGVILSQVARLDQLKPEDRLDPARVVADLEKAGRLAFYEPDVDAIIARLQEHAREGDVIAVLSNGGFGGIHERLLREL